MIPPAEIQDLIDELARDPLRHIVLLKHLLAWPEHVKVHRVSGLVGAATMVLLDAWANAWDRLTYPNASVVAFISSDHPDLTASLLSAVPPGVGVVFKLSREADLAPVETKFTVERRSAFVSFTSNGAFAADPGVRVEVDPGDGVYRLFAEQGHERARLEPLSRDGRAFACMLERDGEPLSACFAFENSGPVWEVGGVVTLPSYRKQGLGARVVRTALAELAQRRLVPRYQVEEDNEASIGLARSVGLVPFLTIVHYAHEC